MISRPLNVLVACEFSGVVRRAFRALGHNAMSCDLLPAEDGSPWHLRCDAVETAKRGCCVAEDRGGDEILRPWDLVIAHPPCTYLCNSGVRWLYTNGRGHERDEARWTNMKAGARFFADLWNACGDTPRAFENPTMHMYGQSEIDRWAKPVAVPFGKHPDMQRIDPRDFGHMETKLTGIHLYGLPHLRPTKIVRNEAALLTKAERSRVHYASPGPDRWKERSRTLDGIGRAMASQWSGYLLNR